MTFDDALAQLFRVPHGDFVNERKRLAAEVKTAGDKPGAAKLAKLGRPPISAWAVNQLWWQAPELFEELFSTARSVREGDLAVMPAHKAALAKLRTRGAEVLTAAGNAAADATVRRIDTTLSALAASGGFDPDPPGALTEDRDAPGFASLGISSGPASSSAEPRARNEEPKEGEQDEEPQKAAALARAKAKAKAEAEAEAEAAAIEKKKHGEAVRAAQVEVDRARAEVHRVEAELAGCRKTLAAAEARLLALA